MLYPFTQRVLFPLIRKYISSVRGEENIPNTAPFIVAANHISQADPLFIIATIFPIIQKKVHFISNPGNRSEWFQRNIARKWAGCILLDPNHKKKCLDEGIKILQQNGIVGIFPEGQRQPNEKALLRGKTGVARMALMSGAPILPVGIITKGERHRKRKNNEPYSHHADAINQFVIKGTTAELVIGKLLHFQKIKPEDTTYGLLRSTTNTLMRIIAKLSGKRFTE